MTKATKIFKEMAARKFPTLEKEMDIQIQEAYRTSNRHGQKIIFPCNITVKMSKLQSKKMAI